MKKSNQNSLNSHFELKFLFIISILILQMKTVRGQEIPFLDCCVKGQMSNLPSDFEIVHDSFGDPWYYKNQIIIAFEPSLMKKNNIDNKDFQSGVLIDFIDDGIIEIISGIGVNYSQISNFRTDKIFHNMTSNDTISITRLNDTILNGKPWSTVIVFWKSNKEFNVLDICDSLNKFYPWIIYAHPNYFFRISSTTMDPKYTSGIQKGLDNFGFSNAHINVDPAWNFATGKDNIKLGILDMGILKTHEDFNNLINNTCQVKTGYDYFNNHPNPTVWSGADHGTLSAGVIGALRNNMDASNNYIGIAGVAGGDNSATNLGVSLYDLKISDDYIGVIAVADAADAIREGSDFTPNFGFGLHILNNSWNEKNSAPFTNSEINLIEREVRNAFKNSVIFVNSRGNEGSIFRSTPASLRDEWVLSVGMSDQSGNRTSGNYGNEMDIIAPGASADLVHSLRSNSNNSYGGYMGTSASCPLTSGVAALMLSYLNSANNNAPENLSPEDVEFLIQKYASDRNLPYYDLSTGWGLLNAGNVMEHINKTVYHIRHFNYNANTSNAILISTSPLQLTKPFGNNLPAGIYNDVKKYKINSSYFYSLPWGTNIINAWARNSSSDFFGGISPLAPESDVSIISFNNNSINFEAYIYEFTKDLSGNPINVWAPLSNNNTFGKIAFTLHTSEVVPMGNIEAESIQNSYLIFPNPASKYFEIGEVIDAKTLRIYDISGKIVKTFNINKNSNNNNSFDISEIENGVYIIELDSESKFKNQKLIINHEN